MAFTNGVVEELRREHRLVQQHRTEMDARIQAIEVLLAKEAVSETSLQPPVRHTSVPRPRSHAKYTSLRLHVLRALEHMPSTTAVDLTQRLQGEGVRVGGATSLRERIAHELSRLKRKGVLRKYRNGRYALRRVNGSVPSPAVADNGATDNAVPAQVVNV